VVAGRDQDGACAGRPLSRPDVFAEQVDIAPTIVDHLGLPIAESWEGPSLLTPSRTAVHVSPDLLRAQSIAYRKKAGPTDARKQRRNRPR